MVEVVRKYILIGTKGQEVDVLWATIAKEIDPVVIKLCSSFI